MNEVTMSKDGITIPVLSTVTISTEEYQELLMCRTRLNILSAYVEDSDRCYLDDHFVALILGVTRKVVE